MHKYLVVIPARAGSKRLPRKNYLSVGGRTLIQRAADSVRESQIYRQGLVRLIFCTEDDELAGMARDADLEVVMRPAWYAGDVLSLWLTPQYVCREIGNYDPKKTQKAEIVMLALVTSPFRRGHHFDAVAQAFEDHPEIRRVTTCYRAPFRFEWFYRKRGGYLELVDLPPGTNRFDPEPSYLSSGLVEGVRGLETMEFLSPWPPVDKTLGVEVEPIDAVDIDYLHEYRFAEFLAQGESQC